MDKFLLQQQVLERLAEDLLQTEQALRMAYEAATHEENIAENKYDTLGLEAAYLATGQARRAEALRQAMANWRQFRPPPYYAKWVSPSKLDPFALKLAGWLKTEAGRSRKQRRTVKQMYVDLQALGYGGSYNRVAAFARLWHEQRLVAQQTTGRGTFVPLTFGPGEAFQFDWSEDWAVIGGVRTKLQVAHFKLSHSRAFYQWVASMKTTSQRRSPNCQRSISRPAREPSF